MEIIFTKEAKADLDELRVYLEPLSPSGLTNVTKALEKRITSIPENPNIGRPTPCDDVREVIETKYGFVIPYTLRQDTLFILRVYRGQRRPIDHGVLDLL